ncbi:MAG: DNA polymerase ligase N-terminal domain-containing protein [Gemmata sp.]
MRFVVLTHDWPRPHWDFLVESGAVLRAWRLFAEPVAGTEVAAEPNFDHRLFYLTHEGPVSGGRGTVARWDAGTCDWCADEPARVELDLRGARLAGRAVILREARGWVFRLTARPAAR